MKRRKAREHALQILFQLDIRKEKPSAVVLRHFWAEYQPDDEVKAFAEEIIKGTYKHLAEINKLIHAVREELEPRPHGRGGPQCAQNGGL